MALPLPDLTALQDVTGRAILRQIQLRNDRQEIYVYIGDVLYAINPLSTLPIYGPQVGIQYCKSRELGDFPPHIYALARRVYQYLTCHNKPQCVLLNGDSGSGKTESCKMVVSQLVRESENIKSSLQHSKIGYKITEALNLLEAFGNAATLLNDNASRFSKAVDILYDQKGVLVGANIEVHHFEKSRISGPSPGEQNFRILYCLLAGSSFDELQSFHLQGAYRLVSPATDKPLFADEADYDFNKDRFFYIRETLDQLNMDFKLTGRTEKDMGILFGILAAILHLGNIEFASGSGGEVWIVNELEVEFACHLLGVGVNDMMMLLLSLSVSSQGYRINSHISFEEANMMRNKLIQELYSRLFEWLLYHINLVLYPDDTPPGDLQCVTVVDPPGFESRTVSSLEQLHINLLSEQLVHYANDNIYQNEYEDCTTHGIRHPTKVYWNDNSKVIELLDIRGVVGVIDDVTRLTNGDDSMLLTKLNHTFNKKKQFSGNNTGTYFTIHHTATTINYSVEDFLRKNRDETPEVIMVTLGRSHNKLVSTLFTGHTGGVNNKTLSETFQMGTTSIIEKMRGKHLHLINCIKPNKKSEPSYFDMEYVMKQLEVTSTIELVKLKRKGYSDRLTLQEFITRYQLIGLPLTSPIQSLSDAFHRIISRSKLPTSNIVVTQSMVFMNYWHVDKLDRLMIEEIRNVVKVQSVVRRYLAIKRVRRLFYESRSRWNRSTFDDPIYENYIRRSSDTKAVERFDSIITVDLIGIAAFYQKQLDRVFEKRQILEAKNWCKLIYVERSRELARFYISEKEIEIDGSYDGYSLERLGVGSFKNVYRDEEVAQIRSYIREGVILRRDVDGNIWALRLCDKDIIVHGYDDPSNHCLSADVIIAHGRLPYRQPMKIFDVKELKAHIGLELQSSVFNKERLGHQCFVCLSFVREEKEMLATPVWLCVINLIALDMIDDPNIHRDIQSQLTQLKLESREERELKVETDIVNDQIKQRHDRPSWSRTDHRASLESVEVSPSKLRMELRKKGKNVKDHMMYSWDDDNISKTNKSKPAKTMEDLQQQFSSDYSAESENHDNDWNQPFQDYGMQRNDSDWAQGSNIYQHQPRKDWARIRSQLKVHDAQREAELSERPNRSEY